MLRFIRFSRGCLLAAAAGFLTASALPAVEAPGPARLAADLSPGTQPDLQRTGGMARLGNRLVYIRQDGEQYPVLWTTDGTRRGP